MTVVTCYGLSNLTPCDILYIHDKDPVTINVYKTHMCGPLRERRNTRGRLECNQLADTMTIVIAEVRQSVSPLSPRIKEQ